MSVSERRATPQGGKLARTGRASERRATLQGGISHATGQNLPVRLAGSSLETGIKTDGVPPGDLLLDSGMAELWE